MVKLRVRDVHPAPVLPAPPPPSPSPRLLLVLSLVSYRPRSPPPDTPLPTNPYKLKSALTTSDGHPFQTIPARQAHFDGSYQAHHKEPPLFPRRRVNGLPWHQHHKRLTHGACVPAGAAGSGWRAGEVERRAEAYAQARNSPPAA